MIQDILVRLTLSMPQQIIIFRVWGVIVARFEVREVALDVAGSAAATGGGETDVGGHRLIDNRDLGEETLSAILGRRGSPNKSLVLRLIEVQRAGES